MGRATRNATRRIPWRHKQRRQRWTVPSMNQLSAHLVHHSKLDGRQHLLGEETKTFPFGPPSAAGEETKTFPFGPPSAAAAAATLVPLPCPLSTPPTLRSRNFQSPKPRDSTSPSPIPSSPNSRYSPKMARYSLDQALDSPFSRKP